MHIKISIYLPNSDHSILHFGGHLEFYYFPKLEKYQLVTNVFHPIVYCQGNVPGLGSLSVNSIEPAMVQFLPGSRCFETALNQCSSIVCISSVYSNNMLLCRTVS